MLGRGRLRLVMSAELPMQMYVIPGNVYNSIKDMISLKFFQHT